MKRAPALLLLFAVSVGAGAWLTLSPPAPPTAPGETGSCGQSASCDAIPDDAQVAAPTSDAPLADTRSDAGSEAAPGRTGAAPAPAVPASPADGIRLREEADRLIAEGRAMEGLAALRKATEADPSARNHGDLGSMLERLTAFDDAVRHLRRAAELDPANADRWIALANAYYRKVELGEAWKAERRAREAEPGLVLVTDPQGRRVRAGDSAADKP